MSSLKEQVQELKKEVQELKQMVEEFVKEEKQESKTRRSTALVNAIRQEDTKEVMKRLLNNEVRIEALSRDDASTAHLVAIFDYYTDAMVAALEVGNPEIINYILLASAQCFSEPYHVVERPELYGNCMCKILYTALKYDRKQMVEYFIDSELLTFVDLDNEYGHEIFDTHVIEIIRLQTKYCREDFRGVFPVEWLSSTTVDRRLIDAVNAGMFLEDEDDKPKESPMYRQYLKERAEIGVDLIKKTRSPDVSKAIMSFM